MNNDIRQSQAIHTWPPGAIIDFPQLSLIMLCHDHGPDDWGVPERTGEEVNKRKIINDPRLANAFGVDAFILPPVEDGIGTLRLSAIRFPGTCYCPRCGLMQNPGRQGGERIHRSRTYDAAMEPFECRDCLMDTAKNPAILIPMRFVIATEDGFLDDFPWDWYVHRQNPEQRRRGHHLFYRSRGSSASLSDIMIESRNTAGELISSTSLASIFDQKIFTRLCPEHGHFLDYSGYRLSKPWKGWAADGQYIKESVSPITVNEINNGNELSAKAKRIFPRTMQRGAGNLIFPIIYSGILLPSSTYQHSCPPAIARHFDTLVGNLKTFVPDTYKDYTDKNWKEYLTAHFIEGFRSQDDGEFYTGEQMAVCAAIHFGSGDQRNYGERAEQLRAEEYLAFTGPVMDDRQRWFSKRKISGHRYNEVIGQELIAEVILLDKLSALKVFKGFTRIRPLMTEELIFARADDPLTNDQRIQLAQIQDSRKFPERTRELPAVEVRGEGIFVKLSNSILNEWGRNYPQERLDIINSNLLQSNIDFNRDDPPLNKRYLFLHTLSHIILKELSEDCGYSLSSLAEIIYCSTDELIGSPGEMNGILIYTTTSDAEGSMGGLVEKGTPEYFGRIILRAVEKARWCSSDPLCISTTSGQGFLGLNLSACYSCTLLPETSCEKMNKYLDRAALVGTLQDSSGGLFSSGIRPVVAGNAES